VFYNEHIIKRTKTSSKILSIFSIVIVTSILILNINIEKSFAIEKESISSSLNPSGSKLNNQVAKFTNCIINTIKNGDSSHLPKFFKNEPTKTDIAICFRETTNKQI
jgi:hypothetical protein